MLDQTQTVVNYSHQSPVERIMAYFGRLEICIVPADEPGYNLVGDRSSGFSRGLMDQGEGHQQHLSGPSETDDTAH